jgi:hypothetical protein
MNKSLGWFIQTLRMIFITRVLLLALFHAGWLEIGSSKRETCRNLISAITTLYLAKYLITGMLFVLSSCILFYLDLRLPGLILLIFGITLVVLFRSRWICRYWDEISLLLVGILTDTFIGNIDRFIESYGLETTRGKTGIYYCYWVSPWQEQIMLGASDNPAVAFYLAQEKIMCDTLYNTWYMKNLETALKMPRKEILPILYPENKQAERSRDREPKPGNKRLERILELAIIKHQVNEASEEFYSTPDFR